MRSRLPTRRQVLWTVGIGSLLVALAVFIFLGYYHEWQWTGFPPKRLFDWIQILVIPVAVAIGTFVLNQAAKRRDDEAQEAQREREDQLQHQRTEDATLQAYLDYVSGMLTDPDRPLRRSRLGVTLSVAARAQTLTALGRLQDGDRKGSVIQFLYEAGLIKELNNNRPVISLRGADLREANLPEADLQKAYLREANFREAYLREADLQRAYLQRAYLREANLQGAYLREANLYGANLQRANLQGAYLNGAKLQGADLYGADLYGADLREANLQRANLQRANLQRANLPEAKLQGADLNGAYLQRANLNGANLQEAKLQGAYLQRANLQDADLADAEVSKKQLATALSLEGATMPDGSIHP